jgi:hypothetical protein
MGCPFDIERVGDDHELDGKEGLFFDEFRTRVDILPEISEVIYRLKLGVLRPRKFPPHI